MKKIISIFAICALLACTVLEVAVSAAGDVLWKEDFSSEDPNNWLWDDSAFFVEDGVCKGWGEAVVHQSNFPTANGGTRKYGQSALTIKCIAYEDGGKDSEYHRLGLWWADYIDPYATDDPTSWIIYKPLYNFEDHCVELEMEFTGDEAEAFRPVDFPDDAVVARYEIPENEAPQFGTEWFSIGYRVNAGVFSIYLNNKKIVDFPCYRGALTGTQRPSPVILLNGGCYCGFDDLVVTTPDYDLFGDGAETIAPAVDTEAPAGDDAASAKAPAGNDASAATEKVIEKENVVVGTDADGSAVTEVVTREVARPAANTGAKTTGGSAAKTGDAVIVVVAVMIASLGCAIVVKKVLSDR